MKIVSVLEYVQEFTIIQTCTHYVTWFNQCENLFDQTNTYCSQQLEVANSQSPTNKTNQNCQKETNL